MTHAAGRQWTMFRMAMLHNYCMFNMRSIVVADRRGLAPDLRLVPLVSSGWLLRGAM
jgi:hypothetical protein